MAAQAGHIEAFEALVTCYQDLAVRVAYMITGDESMAEDVAQEAFLKAYRALPHFRCDAPLRPWLIKIVANEAKNQRKGRARRARLDLHISMSAGSGADPTTPELAALAAERRQSLFTALETLRDEDRLLIASRYFLSLSEAEMAALLGCPKGTVKSRLARALARLRGKLEQQEAAVASRAVGRGAAHG